MSCESEVISPIDPTDYNEYGFHGSLGNYIISTQEALSIPEDVLELYDRGLPGGFSDLSSKSGPFDTTVQYTRDDVSSLVRIGEEQFKLCGPLSEVFVKNLPYTCYIAGEYGRQNRLSAVTAHASAAASPAGVGVVLMGNKGTGKTSTILNLCKSEGYQLYGDDMIVIRDGNESIVVYPGNLNMSIRPLPETLRILGISTEPGAFAYEQRLVLCPEQVEIAHREKPDVASVFVRVSVHPGNEEKVSDSNVRNANKEVLRLREDLCRHIRGITLMLESSGIERGFCESFDNQELQNMRDGLVEKIVNEHPFYYVQATDAASAAKIISSIVESSV